VTEELTLTREAAMEHVMRCMADPSAYASDPLTMPSAQLLFNDKRMHQCYWNDRFAVAVMCGMDEQSQRIAAWAAVSNGLKGYWEWETHAEYDAAAVLKHLGIIPADFDPNQLRPKGRFPDYNHLPVELCKALIDKFKLPTTLFGRPDLTEKQLADQRKLDGHYAQLSPLKRY
jgi:hypothetical protein